MNNSLLVSTSSSQLQKLQRVQNAAARLICGSKKHDHITPVFKLLHWLPIQMRVTYKLFLLMFKAFHNAGPVNLSNLIALVIL